jgi:hypothetical protein
MPTVSDLASSLNAQINARTSDCALIELGPGDSPTGDSQVFQYYPDSISDNKAVNYQQKAIFGGSLPLYQFTGGGERTISFSAVFTCDTDLLAQRAQASSAILYARLKAAGVERRNVDIRAALMWLRGFMLPRYADSSIGTQLGSDSGGTQLTFAPHKILLTMPGTGIGFYGGFDSVSGPDAVLCHMSQCDITIGDLFPSGLPRNATVQLSFAQLAQSRGFVQFPSRTSSYDDVRKGTAVFFAGGTEAGEVLSTNGYNFPPRGTIFK